MSKIRSRELRTLNELLLDHHQVIIHGNIGVGKSDFAQHYAQTAVRDRKYRSIFWLDASNGQSMEIGFVTLAREMGILEDPERPHQMATIAIRWLQDHEDWLLILDNV